MTHSQAQQLLQKIAACQSAKQFSLRTRLQKLTQGQSSTKGKDSKNSSAALNKLIADIDASQQWVLARQNSLPPITFSDTLPINQKQTEIANLIRDNQVIVIAGETGSGKTTQIPKICLALGLGNKGLIAHTQPRRIAARTVASRIAEELATPLGDVVGYQVRFADQLSDNTRVKLMTDGVLLAEMQQDRYLNQYEVIIIDEAHERSLNIDFLLGLLKRLLKQRPELKLIITSATIDLEKFSQHFNNAPIIEVSGRTFPVDVLYQAPLDSAESSATQAAHSERHNEARDRTSDVDLPNRIANTVEFIIDQEARGEFIAQGDILVFCAGEREIRDASQALQERALPLTVLPLYSRLGIQEQNRVFKPAQLRKVVLATNVAETSITVPGIGYVIDPGVARISRYSFRSKVQRLPIEAISQASANQRMGRCGRVANGVCIRLYSEEDFQQRPAFTDAELMRSNLAAVIMQMLQLGIHDIAKFPFIDHPDTRLLNDGFKLLQELQAIDIKASPSTTTSARKTASRQQKPRLTAIGRLMSRLPIDPKYARMLFEANQQQCLHESLIIVAALNIQDPREWPGDKQQAAREKHRLLAHSRSDFLSYLILWQRINQQRKALTNKQFKEYCRQHFLSIVRVFEWRDMVKQLKQNVQQLGWTINALEPTLWLPQELTQETTQKTTTTSKANKNKAKTQGSKQLKAQLSQLSQTKKHSNKTTDKTTDSAEQSRYEPIHRSLLSGLLSNIAIHDEDNQYLATRGRHLMLFPASSLANKKRSKKAQQSTKRDQRTVKNDKAKWIIANELIETSRLFAHTAAQIEPSWVLSAGQHLLHYHYSEPHYHERAGAVKAQRQATLYGLTLRDKKAVLYSDIDPQVCRELFIQQALVEGAYSRHPQYQGSLQAPTFFEHNQQLIAAIEENEAKLRRRNLLVSDMDIFRLYDERIPQHITNWVSFEQWRKQQPTQNVKHSEQANNLSCLHFSTAQLTLNNTDTIDVNKPSFDVGQFPNALNINGKDLALRYHFNPLDAHDGVTIEIPMALLPHFPDHIGDWLVPGLLREKCIALIKTLPKNTRKLFAPAANAVDRVLPQLADVFASQSSSDIKPLSLVLGEKLTRATGHKILANDWQMSALDDYYKLNYCIVETASQQTEQRQAIKQSRDLAALKKHYAKTVQTALKVDNAPARKTFERDNIEQWDFGEWLAHVDYQHHGMTVRAYPMLHSPNSDINASPKNATPNLGNNPGTTNIALSLHESAEFAQFCSRHALVELALKSLKQQYQYLSKELFKAKSRHDATALHLLSLAPNKAAQKILAQSIIKNTLKQCCFAEALPNNVNHFDDTLTTHSQQWMQQSLATETLIIDIAKKLGEVQRKISDIANSAAAQNLAVDERLEDIKNGLFDLFDEGYLDYTPFSQLKHYPRYLQGITLRLEKIHQASMDSPTAYIEHVKVVNKYVTQQLKQASNIDLMLADKTMAQAFIYESQPALFEHMMMLQEWRISLFAQQLKTSVPISEKRILKHWQQLLDDA